jgi:carboxyl-terminal processing protease
VYGGGGITPDYIVDPDTLQKYTAALRARLYEFIQGYMDRKGPELRETYSKNELDKFIDQFKVTDSFLQSLVEFAEGKKIEYNEEQFNKDKDNLRYMVKAQIARILFGNEGFFKTMLLADNQFKKAISLFPEAKKIAGLK